MDDTTFKELISEFKENRDNLKSMVKDIEKLKVKIDRLLPEKMMNQRHKFFFEERVKTIVSLFGVLLDIRKEITKTLKDELELRRKNDIGTEEEIEVDIRGIADRIEKFSKKAGKKIEKIEKEVANG